MLRFTTHCRSPSMYRRSTAATAATATRLLSGGGRQDDVVIPGSRHEYGSLGERPLPKRAPVAWQAENNADVQRVTQKAIIFELAQESSRTLETVVPWFLENMPASYFRQVPERFRNDHVKAIAAVCISLLKRHNVESGV